ncbi:hypothetical protein BJ322DRAFT_1022954 [Thelephora terrestris]|uniref:Uncharacterized protein n=1 Tax=Thelephora terrestris TaxID=56493 RepID=A0A9P6HA85_9AGAM|nr:hypothetical protein BJ322DRAFT_1022954 [Thelephora terrestris]
MAYNQLTYPPDIDCFTNGDYSGLLSNFTMNNCSITNNMVKFLNLTGQNYKPYLNAYCTSPPSNDNCPFGFCPNSDIAGLWVRIATIIIFYAPDRIKEAFWSQVLLTYSLLLTCGLSLLKHQLTRFHSIVLLCIVCSPGNVYFVGYAIRAFWGTHRLDGVLGRKRYVRRAMVFFALTVWIAILIHAYLPLQDTKFVQQSCSGATIVEAFFLWSPFVLAWDSAKGGSEGILFLFTLLAIPILVTFAWFVAIIRRRREIWDSNRSFCAGLGEIWRTIVKNYPFLLFCSAVVIPTAYWILTIELGVFEENDEISSLTFSQVLAMFAAVPPVIEVVPLVPRLWEWVITLSWLGRVVRHSKTF